MRLDRLRTKLVAEHYYQPQTVARIEQALGQVQDGLEKLAAMGHSYHLEPGGPTELPEWPKIMFHPDRAPNGRSVASKWELVELGPDWYETFAEAQEMAGRRAQFRGRGGVGFDALPAVVVEGEATRPRPQGDVMPKSRRDSSAR